MSKRNPYKFTIEGNAIGMPGVEGPRLAVFCNHPHSFLDVSRRCELYAVSSGDYGSVSMYRDDARDFRIEVHRHWRVMYSVNLGRYVDDAVVLKFLEGAMQWCADGGDLVEIPTEVADGSG